MFSNYELKKQFHEGGLVKIKAAAQNAGTETLDMGLLLALVKKHSETLVGKSKCEGVHIEGFKFDRVFDLKKTGNEANPVLALKLQKCTFLCDFDATGAVLRELVITDCEFLASICELESQSSIVATGATVIGDVVLESCTRGPARIDFSRADLRQECRFEYIGCSPAIAEPTFIKSISLAHTRCRSGVTIRAITIRSEGQKPSLDAEEAIISGTLKIVAGSKGQQSDIAGTIRLRGAHISGQLLFESLKLVHQPEEANKEFFPLAIMAEGLTVDGDVFFRQSPDSANGCDVRGQIDMVGATVQGEMHVYGKYDATQHRIRAFKALRIKVGGDLRFGWIPEPRTCSVTGECDFSEAAIAGRVIFSGSVHTLTLFNKQEKVRRKQGVSINMRRATIGSDLIIEGSNIHQQRSAMTGANNLDGHGLIEGISIINATVGGRLLITGATISAKLEADLPRKAVTANGVIIRGGIEVTEDQHAVKCGARRTTITGDFRLRRAQIDGHVIFRGVELTATPAGKGIALWAANSRFGSDVVFEPYLSEMPITRGELRFWGATIAGTLYVQGIDLTADKTGTAIDCYTAEIKKGVVIGDFHPAKTGRDGDKVSCNIKGLISFNFSHAQSLTIGNDPSVSSSDSYLFHLTGVLLMRDMKVEGATVISNVLLTPLEGMDEIKTMDAGRTIKESAKLRLEELATSRTNTVIHANYACLGTRLFVRLREKSKGLITLYGATAGTIGAVSGKDPNPPKEAGSPSWLRQIVNLLLKPRMVGFRDQKIAEYWGNVDPRHPSPPRGKPRKIKDAEDDILLNLDEFTYQRLNDKDEMDPPSTWRDWTTFIFLGRPLPKHLNPRYEWLQRQVENPGPYEAVILSPYRQLTKAYREIGDLQRSYSYIKERRWLQILHGRQNFAQRWIDGAFSAMFGFGYSPIRAAITLLVLFGASFLFVWRACEQWGYVSDASNSTNPCELLNPDPKGQPPAFFDIAAEAYKLIFPLTRLQEHPGCTLDHSRSWLRFSRAALQLISWIIFPFVAITFSGVLREKSDT